LKFENIIGISGDKNSIFLTMLQHCH